MIFGVAVKFWSGAAAVLEEFLGVDSLVRLRRLSPDDRGCH